MQYESGKSYDYISYSELSGLSKLTVRKYISDGKIQGEIRGKFFYVDGSEFLKLPNVVETKPVVPEIPIVPVAKVETVQLDGELSVEAQKKKQELIDRRLLADEETKTLEAEMKKSEAERKRDLPDVLLKREKEVSEREKLVAQKESDLTSRIQVVEIKEKEIADKYETANKYVALKQSEADKILKDATEESDTRKEDADTFVLSSQEILKKLNETVAEKENEILNLEAKITEYPAKITPLKRELRYLMGIADRQATKHYKTAQKTTGQVSTYHTKKSNALFDMKDMFRKLEMWLGV